jgi:hypothetical protein
VVLVVDEVLGAGPVGQADHLALERRHVLDAPRLQLRFQLLDPVERFHVVAQPAGLVPAVELIGMAIGHVDLLAAEELGGDHVRVVVDAGDIRELRGRLAILLGPFDQVVLDDVRAVRPHNDICRVADRQRLLCSRR